MSDNMAYSFHIHYDGNAPGLESHRLSMSAFGRALDALLQALRRSISNELLGADHAERGARGGRYAGAAEAVDLQLQALDEGSVNLRFAIDVHGQVDLFAVQAGLRAIVEGLRAESAGERVNPSVRRYLQALPAGLSSHAYEARDGDTVFADTRIGAEMKLPAPQDEARGRMLDEVRATIRGVDFDPPAVRIALEDGKQTLSATPAQVEAALLLRDAPVRIRYLVETGRLIDLCAADDAPTERSIDDETDAVFERWHEVLARLSR